MSSVVKCQFCHQAVEKRGALDHLNQCLKQDVVDYPCSSKCELNFDVFDNYYLLAFVLNLVQNWIQSTPLTNDQKDLAFQIYKYFYFFATENVRIEVFSEDPFFKAVLDCVEEPNEQYLQVVPALDKRFFLNGPLKGALSYIFSRAQINNIKNGEAFHGAP